MFGEVIQQIFIEWVLWAEGWVVSQREATTIPMKTATLQGIRFQHILNHQGAGQIQGTVWKENLQTRCRKPQRMQGDDMEVGKR